MLFIFDVLFVRAIGIDTYSSYTFISLLPSIPVYYYFITYLFISCLQTFRLFTVFVIINTQVGTSLVVQWLRLLTPSAGGPGLIPDQGIPNEDRGSGLPQLRPCSQIHTKNKQVHEETRPSVSTLLLRNLPHDSIIFQLKLFYNFLIHTSRDFFLSLDKLYQIGTGQAMAVTQ